MIGVVANNGIHNVYWRTSRNNLLLKIDGVGADADEIRMQFPGEATVTFHKGEMIVFSEGKFYFIAYSEANEAFVSSEIDGQTGKAVTTRTLAIGKTTSLVDGAVLDLYEDSEGTESINFLGKIIKKVRPKPPLKRPSWFPR